MRVGPGRAGRLFPQHLFPMKASNWFFGLWGLLDVVALLAIILMAFGNTLSGAAWGFVGVFAVVPFVQTCILTVWEGTYFAEPRP